MSSAIPWTSIKALSFDIYGTLIDWESGIASTARSTVLGPYLPLDHRTFMLGIEKHDTRLQRENPTMLQSAVIAEGLKRYAAELGIVESGKLTQEEVDRAADEYGVKIGTYPAFGDTIRAIQTLSKHYKLIPLSNIDRASFDQTLAGPLSGCKFDAIYIAEDIGSYKPSLKNFHYLLDHLKSDFGVEKNELCHVAQSLFHDHGPAKEMGLTSVWVDRKGAMGGETSDSQEKYGYQLRVESLGELAGIVEEAFGKVA